MSAGERGAAGAAPRPPISRRYPYRENVEAAPPDYARVVRTLTDEEIEDEILAGRGEPGYQLALLAEVERRGKEDDGD